MRSDGRGPVLSRDRQEVVALVAGVEVDLGAGQAYNRRMLAVDGSLHTGRARILGAALVLGLTVLTRHTVGQPPDVVKTIYSFTGQSGDGSVPQYGVIIGANKELYGTTSLGGAWGAGTVFELKPPPAPGGTWTETVIYSFPSGSGYPNGLTLGPDGAIYGTTTTKGELHPTSWGTLFELKPPATAGEGWTETVIHNFTATGDGLDPIGTLVIGKDGVLYGATTHGGTGPCAQYYGGYAGCGTVFELRRLANGAWEESVLYSFKDDAYLHNDGIVPQGLVMGEGGILYGVTISGGTSGVGTAFELQPPAVAGGAWTETVIHNFATYTDGGNPDSTPVIGTNGAIYGGTEVGGGDSPGSVFQLTPPAAGGDWTDVVLWNFVSGGGGFFPGGLALGAEGVLYGTTQQGRTGCGASGCGVVFELSPSADGTWTETVLHEFTGQNGDGATPYPFATLAIGANKAIYGTTTAGGDAGLGVVFELDR